MDPTTGPGSTMRTSLPLSITLAIACTPIGSKTPANTASNGSGSTCESPTRVWDDADGDGFGDATRSAYTVCVVGTAQVTNNDDCDDTNADINPDAKDECNFIDDDCDQFVDEDEPPTRVWLDDDEDGFGDAHGTAFSVCVPAGKNVTNNTDCDDTDPDVHPDAKDVCNYRDDDCDRFVDEDEPPTQVWRDEDEDGYGDANGTAFSVCVPGGKNVTNREDCDDTDAAVNPMAKDVCNYRDDDCDRFVDEDVPPTTVWDDNDGDGYGDMTGTPYSVCVQGSSQVQDNSDCDDSDSAVFPGATDTCNFADDDCDGLVDEDDLPDRVWPDSDGDGHGDGLYTASLACSVPSGWASTDDDCDDADAAVSPSATEACTGVDDDCDGSIDEGAVCYTGLCSDITTDTTWTTGTTQTISCAVDVNNGATLTIEDGVTVEFEAGAALTVGEASSGTLNANGSTLGVLFTSALATPAAGDWGGLVFGANHTYSSLMDVVIEYGGDTDACIDLQGGSLGLLYATVRDCAGAAAIAQSGGDFLVQYLEVLDNDGMGIAIEPGSVVDYWYDVDITGNGDVPLMAPLDALAVVNWDTSTSSYTGNTTDEIIVVGGAFDGTSTLLDLGVPYALETDLTVDGTGGLTAFVGLEEGVELRVAAGVAIEVGTSGPASFQAYSFSSSNPPVITSGAATPAAGDWEGITIGSYDDASYFENAEVRYGGGNGLGNLVFASSSGNSADVDTVVIADSAAWGIYRSPTATTSPNITNVTYSNNALGDLY